MKETMTLAFFDLKERVFLDRSSWSRLLHSAKLRESPLLQYTVVARDCSHSTMVSASRMPSRAMCSADRKS